MTGIKRPQEELKAYFDKLLTEDTSDQEVHDTTSASQSIASTVVTSQQIATPLVAAQPIPTPQLQPQRHPQTAASDSEFLVVRTPQKAAYGIQQQRLQQLLQGIPLSDELAVESQEVVAKEGNTDLKMDSLALDFAPLSSEWLDNGRPAWAQAPFDILLLDVSGLKLAVPLASLGQIHSIDGAFTSLFGQSDWFMGIQATPLGNLKTVNTSRFIEPEHKTHSDHFKFVVALNGLDWGLAVDHIDQPLSVDPENIKWRPKRIQRPWAAGTLKEHMCVLMDIPVLGEILVTKDSNNPVSESHCE